MYETCSKLRGEVLSRLNDSERLSLECAQYYHEACLTCGAQELTLEQWQDMTSTFVDRVSLNDPRRKERTYKMVEQLCPKSEMMTENMFTKCTVAVLTLAERDLRERIMKLQAKYAGAPGSAKSIAHLDPVTPLMLDSHPPWPESHLSMPVSSEPELRGDDLRREFNLDAPPSLFEQTPPVTARNFDKGKRHMWQSLDLQDSLSTSSTMAGSANQRGSPASTGLQTPVEELRSRQFFNPSVPSTGTQDCVEELHSSQSLDVTLRRCIPSMSGPSASPEHSGLGGYTQYRSLSAGFGSYRDESNVTSNTGRLQQATERRPVCAMYSADPLEQMKHDILHGDLQVFVYNKQFQLEVKKLALDHSSKRMYILGHDGVCDDFLEIDGLISISQGVSTAIMDDPPPPERAIAFRFGFAESRAEDSFLCVVFDYAETAQLASQAFSELCGVPVIHA